MTRFSDRFGYQPDDVEITIRFDAPDELRDIIVDIAYESGLTPHTLRSIVCQMLRKRADPSNWSAFPNVDNEVRMHLGSCEWYRVYDFVEVIYRELVNSPGNLHDGRSAEYFLKEINNYFRQAGIGWQLIDGKLETRGSEAFEYSLTEASSELAETGRTTAANEIHQAIADLSRRPYSDITGAIQHALAALECVVRDVSGDEKATLGTILARNPTLVPSPLNQALEKMWGFASEQGRHLREGREPSYEEAELTVQVAAAVSRYLSKKAES
jgi:hypothetical protein